MRGNNSMITSSLACKGRAQKASKVRENGQIFGPKMFTLPLYLRYVAPSTQIKRGSMAQRTKCSRKSKQKGRERERRKKMRDKIVKKKKKKKSPCAYIFPP